DERRNQVPFLRDKTEPGFCVRRDMDPRLADETLFDFERSILDYDRNVPVFRACEGEMENCVETTGLVWLEDIGHETEHRGNGALSQTVVYQFHRFVSELAACDRFGIRARNDIDRLRAFLQRLDDFLQVPLLVLQIRTDDILARWTDRHTVRRLV